MNKIKVLVVDDSITIRNILTSILAQESEIEVVGEAEDPYDAREKIKQLNPDVLTLDVEMPKMDGLTFLANLMRLRPMPVVMLSTLTTKGADTTLAALETGAVDYITKPDVEALMAERDSFRQTLVTKLKDAAGINLKNLKLSKSLTAKQDLRELPFAGSGRRNHLIAIGASTGGTEAIKSILMCLPPTSPAVVITQHIPVTFSARFANRLNACCPMAVQEARHGQKVHPGNVYIAPGDKHLKIEQRGGVLFCLLEDSPEVNRHKPAVDVLFDSLVPVAGNVQAVLLTGMGQDGARGMLNLKQQGARTLIQNQASSLVWGMPGKAYALNAHTEQYPLGDIAATLLDFALLKRGQMKEVLNVNE
ncbi:protein-glutamate methylesterase/protein-glutamine glutaminase [Thalassomonas actiniarum]|uniref:Protein-glutamate methylesterase/protein-glutamine glutaminase n=1 Tax=Thalassomonas actiniarum TaxID=485447 RepID=A0AAE9YII5_9GAMM|nr:chemotaxis response regulator protein-glutamate methylesterase [Thalassomonas actiniarum]WDD96860.1 chemotaxis response regulator protein-glutamate methylesterase [Thalassomonas actiniarum]